MQTPSELLKENLEHPNDKFVCGKALKDLTIKLLEGVKVWAIVERGYAEDQIKEEQDSEVKEYLFGKRNVASQLEIFMESQLSEIKKI